jgi:hypothetical protein
MEESKEAIEREGKQLARYLCSFQKNSFSMKGAAKAVLEKLGGQRLPDIVTKDRLNQITVAVYGLLEPSKKTQLWKQLTDANYLAHRATEEGLTKLFKICTPQLIDNYPQQLGDWTSKICELLVNMRLKDKSILLLNASGAKGFFKSTGIPLVLHLFLFGSFPHDDMHKNVDLKDMLRSKLPVASKKALEELLSDCTDIPVVQNYVYVSSA